MPLRLIGSSRILLRLIGFCCARFLTEDGVAQNTDVRTGKLKTYARYETKPTPPSRTTEPHAKQNQAGSSEIWKEDIFTGHYNPEVK